MKEKIKNIEMENINMNGKAICPKCKGNGYITIKLQNEKTPHHKDCNYCNNQGEIVLDNKKIERYLNYSRMVQ
jgi:hypothetical protein